MAGGDYYKVEIEAQPQAHIVFTSTAAEKVYRALGAATRCDVRLMLGEDSRVSFLPQETILFDRVRLARSIEIDMAPGARLALCDLVILGRAAMGEDVHTLDWADQWRLRRNNALIWADAARLQGDATQMLAPKATGDGARAFGTLIYAAPDAEIFLEPLRESLNRADNCQAAATAFDGLLVARFIAQDGQGARRAIEQALRVLPDASPPRSWAT
jgi:urease accessory protein